MRLNALNTLDQAFLHENARPSVFSLIEFKTVNARKKQFEITVALSRRGLIIQH